MEGGGGGDFPAPEDKKGIDRVNNLIFGYLIASFEKVSSGSGHVFLTSGRPKSERDHCFNFLHCHFNTLTKEAFSFELGISSRFS